MQREIFLLYSQPMRESEIIKARTDQVRADIQGREPKETSTKVVTPFEGTTCDNCELPKLVAVQADSVAGKGSHPLTVRLNCGILGDQIRSRAEIGPSENTRGRNLPDLSISSDSPCPITESNGNR